MRVLLSRVLLPLVLLGVGFLAVSPPVLGNPPGPQDSVSAACLTFQGGSSFGGSFQIDTFGAPDQPLSSFGTATSFSDQRCKTSTSKVNWAPGSGCLNVLNKHQAYVEFPNPPGGIFPPGFTLIFFDTNESTAVFWNVTSPNTCATQSALNALGPPTSKATGSIQITDG